MEDHQVRGINSTNKHKDPTKQRRNKERILQHQLSLTKEQVKVLGNYFYQR